MLIETVKYFFERPRRLLPVIVIGALGILLLRASCSQRISANEDNTFNNPSTAESGVLPDGFGEPPTSGASSSNEPILRITGGPDDGIFTGVITGGLVGSIAVECATINSPLDTSSTSNYRTYNYELPRIDNVGQALAQLGIKNYSTFPTSEIWYSKGVGAYQLPHLSNMLGTEDDVCVVVGAKN